MLYAVEYANWDTQAMIGNGVSSHSAALVTGGTRSAGNFSSGTTANTTTAMSYRGIEQWYGNRWKRIMGAIKRNISGTPNGTWLFFDNGGLASNGNPDNDYTTHDMGVAQANAWITKLHHETQWDFGMMAGAGSASGSDSTFFADYVYADSILYSSETNSYVPLFGGHWALDSNVGGFCWLLYRHGSYSHSAVGARAAI